MEQFCRESQQTAPLVVTWVLLTIAIVVNVTRIYLKFRVFKTAGWDDYTAIAALVFGILVAAIYTKMIALGMGRHLECISTPNVNLLLILSGIYDSLNLIGIGIVKISVCFCLLRVVEIARRTIARFLWTLLIIVGVTHLVLALIFFFHCAPLAALSNPSLTVACDSSRALFVIGYIGFSVDVITDLICAGIPILVISQLQMNIRTKLALCCLMGLGVFTAVAAVIKALFLEGLRADDYTWGFAAPSLWAGIEQFTGIIIISLPSLRPLFKQFLNVVRSLSSPNASPQGSLNSRLVSSKSKSCRVSPPDSLLSTTTDPLERDLARHDHEERGEEMRDLRTKLAKCPSKTVLRPPAMRQGSLIPELEELGGREQSPDYQARYQQYRDHTHDQRHLSGVLETLSSTRLMDQDWGTHV